MPPKAKYTKEEIIEKAVTIIVNQGPEYLTARNLGAELNTSSRPIFTAFKNMEEVWQCALDYSLEVYHKYWAQETESNSLRRSGLAYIHFAIKESKLFQLLFLQSQKEKVSIYQYMKNLDDCYSDTLNVISRDFNLSIEQSEKLYMNLWIYVHGIATLCATNQCSFSEEEIADLLDNCFNKFLRC